jgi:hypothetical protein
MMQLVIAVRKKAQIDVINLNKSLRHIKVNQT